MIMKITNVKIKINKNLNNNVKADANILIDNCFAIKNIKVIIANNKIFTAMPSIKLENGKYVDVAHPINQETRNMVNERIIKKFYEEVLNTLNKYIKLPEGYYLGHDNLDIQKITLFKSDDNTSTGQGEVVSEYIVEGYKKETLEELNEEINEFLNGQASQENVNV